MPDSKRANVIDGLSSIRAARRAGESGHGRPLKKRPSVNRLPEKPRDNGKAGHGRAPASRIGHTVQPRRHELLCYECGYAFVISGIIRDPICPKCHRTLTKEDLCIDTEWSGQLKTIGNVEIKTGGVVTAGEITARDIIVEGDAREGRLNAGRRLEMGHGGRCDLKTAVFKELRIRPGARITLRRKLQCADLLVEGRLRATVQASGAVRILAGGHLAGSLDAEHLQVEDGGGLTAKLNVRSHAGKVRTESTTR